MKNHPLNCSGTQTRFVRDGVQTEARELYPRPVGCPSVGLYLPWLLNKVVYLRILGRVFRYLRTQKRLARMAGTAQYGKGRDYWDKRYLEYAAMSISLLRRC